VALLRACGISVVRATTGLEIELVSTPALSRSVRKPGYSAASVAAASRTGPPEKSPALSPETCGITSLSEAEGTATP